jgi:hypothetical protein
LFMFTILLDRCYFPYVEKLIIIMNYLHDKLKFGDSIKNICVYLQKVFIFKKKYIHVGLINISR